MGEKTHKKFFNYIVKFWLIVVLLFLITVLFFYGVARGWFGTMPSFQDLENPKSNLASQVISSDGVVLGTFFIENRSNVDYREISPNLINAIIAIEDVRFEKHSGIDQRALARVAFGVLTGNSKGGGSTITQQLAKNLFPRGNLNTPQLILRKFQEWITAVKLERTYSKEEIIAMYLNTVFYGHNAYGIKSASATFFDKKPDSLNLQEAALMAGVVNRPSGYSPISHPEAALERRNLVLHQMEKYGYINQQTYDSVSQLPLGVSKYGMLDHNRGLATYFREYLRRWMKNWCTNHYKANGKPYNLYT
ncbi:MAG TPA: penicillin-binding protein, partial [Bacteroidetes bacterium]|nr:penicillin-binding protein [Bacteroidota bacterium]